MEQYYRLDALKMFIGKIQEKRAISGNLLIGITGKVACGKSRLAEEVKQEMEKSFDKKIIHIPFDFWINPNNLKGIIYAERFYLDDFDKAINSITRNKHWMCPRYDITKKDCFDNFYDFIDTSNEKVVWEEKEFKRIYIKDSFLIKNNSDLYIDKNGLPYSLMTPHSGAVYLIDGTLVARKNISRYYDEIIYVDSLWANRVARMIRRFNRKEVFGETSSIKEEEYVGFLVGEAKKCADKEIENQINDNMIIITSPPDTISNLLDLYYLKERVKNDIFLSKRYLLTLKDIEEAIKQSYNYFNLIRHTDCFIKIHDEFKHLAESRHLISIYEKEDIFQQLNYFLKNDK